MRRSALKGLKRVAGVEDYWEERLSGERFHWREGPSWERISERELSVEGVLY